MFRHKDISECNSKIAVDILVGGIQVRLGKANRILAVLIYPSVKGREILIENFFIRFCFSVQRSGTRASSKEGISWLQGWYSFIVVQEGFQLSIRFLVFFVFTPPLFNHRVAYGSQHQGFLLRCLIDLIDCSIWMSVPLNIALLGKTPLASVIETTVILIHG